ncbi:MAG TPA: LysM peptidoglycan-binding domain-containing protein [Anaerolineae bacterium]|nr:LysM peptidoglycan-binding domain-containing protein [Anaerolineae bacterium]
MSKASFKTEEWELVRNAADWVFVYLEQAERHAMMKGRTGDTKGYTEALKNYQTNNPLIREVIAGSGQPSEAVQTTNRVTVQETWSEIGAILDRRLSPPEADEFREFLMSIGRAVAEATGGGLFGLGQKGSKKEESALDRIAVALKATPADQEARAQAAAEQAKREAEAKAKQEAEAARRQKEEAEAKAKAQAEAAEQARQKAEAERQRKEAEAKAKQEAEAERQRKEAEAKAKAQAEAAEQARQKAEAERQRKEAEAKAQAEAAEQARQKAEAERQRKEAEAKAKAQAEAAQEQAGPAAQPVMAAAHSVPAQPSPQPAPPPAPAVIAQHTVASGETLGGIAQKYYGSAAKWPQIYEANKAVIGANPNLIRPGQVLQIPKLPA